MDDVFKNEWGSETVISNSLISIAIFTDSENS